MIDTSCNTNKTTQSKFSPTNLNTLIINTQELRSSLFDQNLIKSKTLEQEILVKNSKILKEKQAEKKQKYIDKSNKFYEEYNFGIPKYNQFKPKYSLQKIEDFLDEKIEVEKSNGFFTTKPKLDKINKKNFSSFGDNIFSPTKMYHLKKISQNFEDIKTIQRRLISDFYVDAHS